MTPAQFKDARHKLGLSAKRMGQAISDDPERPVNQRTIRRWEDESQDIPGPVGLATLYLLECYDNNRKPIHLK